MATDDAVRTPPDRDTDRRGGLLRTVIACLRADPWLFAPFLFAGVLTSLVDRARLRGPIPVAERGWTDGVAVTVEYVGYPSGVAQTTLPLESMIGLEPPYLLWGLGLSVLALLAVSVAGTLTIARARGVDPTVDAHVRLFGFVVGVDLCFRLLVSPDFVQSMGWMTLVALALLCVLLVRLFVAPALLVGGSSPSTVLTLSSRLVAGRGWDVFGLVLAIGLVAWLLALVPVVGTLLSFTVVAPVHAVVMQVVLERSRTG